MIDLASYYAQRQREIQAKIARTPNADLLLNKQGMRATAAGIRGRIARREWADYKKRFVPLEDLMLRYAQNPNLITDPLRQRATEQINSQYGLAQPMADRRLASYGLSMNPEQRARFQNRTAMDKNLAQVQANNQIKRFGEEQLYNIIGAGTGKYGLTQKA